MSFYPGRGEFTCPQCGSRYFRTDQLAGVGECKGHYEALRGYTGCTFTWPRSEDAKYFERVETEKPNAR